MTRSVTMPVRPVCVAHGGGGLVETERKVAGAMREAPSRPDSCLPSGVTISRREPECAELVERASCRSEAASLDCALASEC